MYQEPCFNQFDLVSLALTDIIDSEINNEPETKEELQKPDDINIRCICGKNHYTEDLIQCPSCMCYLHRECIDINDQANMDGFECPFCKLQLEGIDPFRELRMWIEDKDSEIKQINKLLTDAVQLDQNIVQASYDGYGQRINTQNVANLHKNMQKVLKDAIDHIRTLSSA